MGTKIIKQALLTILFSCSIFESTAQINVSADRDQRLAKWTAFDNGPMDDLLAVQEEHIRQQTIASLLPLLGIATKEAQSHWKPEAPEYEEARTVLIRVLKPIFAEQFSGIHSLAATYSPDYGSFSDIEVDSLYTFANTFPKERWATMTRCSVGVVMALTLVSSKSASKSALDDNIKKLIPNPKDCNPTQKEGEILNAFFQTSAHKKLAQANTRLTDPKFHKQLINVFMNTIEERFQSEILPEVIPVLRKFVARIRSETGPSHE